MFLQWLKKRVVLWLTLLVGLLLLGGEVAGGLPRDNRLVFELPHGTEVRRVSLTLTDSKQDVVRTIDLFPHGMVERSLSHTVSAVNGNYQLSVEFEMRAPGDVDKNHGGGWTRVGVLHQIRLEGANYRFPPPKEMP